MCLLPTIASQFGKIYKSFCEKSQGIRKYLLKGDKLSNKSQHTHKRTRNCDIR